jgi:lipopolysaccharide export system ATP-binding protein
MALLDVRGLEKWYGKRKVVDGVSFEVSPGEVVGLLGPNGAGKTTSFRMTTGQIVPEGGAVFFAGQDVTSLPMYRRARLGMGYLSQEHSYFRKLTVEKNILAILEALPLSRELGRKLRRQERWDRTEAVLEQFGLTHIRHNNAARCSGGEKRRLEIARCLVCEPLLILLDEPFAGVDPLTKVDIRKIVRDLANHGIAILMTDHDVDEVLAATDRIYLIKDGQVLTAGTPDQIVRDDVAIQQYLGEKYRPGGSAPPGARSVPAPAGPAAPAPAPDTVPMEAVLEQEKIYRLIDNLRQEGQSAVALTELIRRGERAAPALLEVLEQRGDVELRRLAHLALQHILGDEAAFDPFAPESQRRLQVADLRERLLRRAG